MRDQLWLGQILDDEALTRGLGDAEARVLVEWLVDSADHVTAGASEEDATVAVRRLCRRGRAISRFVALVSDCRSRGAAHQLAASEGFKWPLPSGTIDACELMQTIVFYEEADKIT